MDEKGELAGGEAAECTHDGFPPSIFNVHCSLLQLLDEKCVRERGGFKGFLVVHVFGSFWVMTEVSLEIDQSDFVGMRKSLRLEF